MFETGKAIREAKLRQIRDDGWQKGRREGIQTGPSGGGVKRAGRKDDKKQSN